MGLSTRFIDFKDFQAPPAQSIISPKFLVYFVLNVISLGIHATSDALAKRLRVSQLYICEKSFMQQINDFNKKKERIEKQVLDLLQSFNSKTNRQDLIKGINDFDGIIQETETLKNFRLIIANPDPKIHLSEIAAGTFDFLTKLFANILSLGIWGVVSNCSLQNRISLLNARNHHLKDQFTKEQEKTIQIFLTVIEKSKEFFKLEKELEDMSQTEKGKAYNSLKEAERKLDGLQKELKEIQKTITDAITQSQAIQSNLKEANQTIIDKNKKIDEINKANDETQLENQKNQKKFEEDLDKEKKKVEEKKNCIDELQKKLKQQQLSKEDTESVKLIAEVGVLPHKYTPRIEDVEIEGANGVNDISQNPDKTQWSPYAIRYNDLTTAQEVLESAFSFAYEGLIQAAEKEKKIRFTNSYLTQGNPSRYCVYRKIIMDLVSGAKLHRPTTQGYELKINNKNVSMVPSNPEKVLKYLPDAEKKELKPKVEIKFTRHDDFTADAQELVDLIPEGVDPVSIKWILNQLSAVEMNHLDNMLMSPAIPNDHPEYMKTLEFMQQGQNPRVKLVDLAYRLICDHAGSMEKKYGSNLFYTLWQKYIDIDNEECFVKEEDNLGLRANVPGTQGPEEKVVEWKLDVDVFGDKRPKDKKPRQPKFAELISDTILNYKIILQPHLEDKILLHPKKPGQIFNHLTWKEVHRQYYVSHEMIEDQYCLFSNLLAVSVTEKKDLTLSNVHCLKFAMANYLEKVMIARKNWNEIKNNNEENNENKQIKELAEIATKLENEIKRVRQCDLKGYIKWLRGEWGAPSLQNHGISEVDIQIYAYTLGVKIAILSVFHNALPSKADKYGRILPELESEYYGPNTKEILIMGSNNGTYYALFPKLDLIDKGIEEGQFNVLFNFETLWNQINQPS